MNPPGALLLYVPAVALPYAFGLLPEFCVAAFGFVASVLSLALSGAILERAGLARQIGPVGVAFACIAILILPGGAFMERDTMAGVFGLPLLAAMAARAARAPVDPRHALAAGAATAAMAILKPPFALVALLPAIYVSAKAGPRVWLRAPEIPAAIVVGLAGMFAFAIFFPGYARNVLPIAVDVYLAIRESLVKLVAAPGVVALVAIFDPGRLCRGGRDRRTLAGGRRPRRDRRFSRLSPAGQGLDLSGLSRARLCHDLRRSRGR